MIPDFHQVKLFLGLNGWKCQRFFITVISMCDSNSSRRSGFFRQSFGQVLRTESIFTTELTLGILARFLIRLEVIIF